MVASRILNAFLSFFPADIDRKSYDNKSYRAVLRAELEQQELVFESHTGYFPRIPDSSFASPGILADYMAEYMLWHHFDLPEVENPALLAELTSVSRLHHDLAKMYGMYKVRVYLRICFNMPYSEWKAAYDAEHKHGLSNARKRKRTTKLIAESKPVATDTLSLESVVAVSQKPLSTEEASLYLGITRHALYKLTSKRLIKHSKPTGRKIYFLVTDLDEWATQNPVRTAREIQAQVKEHEWKQGKGKRR